MPETEGRRFCRPRIEPEGVQVKVNLVLDMPLDRSAEVMREVVTDGKVYRDTHAARTQTPISDFKRELRRRKSGYSVNMKRRNDSLFQVPSAATGTIHHQSSSSAIQAAKAMKNNSGKSYSIPPLIPISGKRSMNTTVANAAAGCDNFTAVPIRYRANAANKADR